MKKILTVFLSLVAYLSMSASLPICRDADYVITMDDKVYMKGRIPVVMMEIEPVSRDAKLYWGSMMSGIISVPAKVVVSYAYSPDWTEYTIVAILFYDSDGNLLEQQENEEDIVWKKTSENSRASDMAAIAKGLPKKTLNK